MPERTAKITRTRWRELRPILMLLPVVILPTVCLLWFMSEAMSNERLAVRQRLSELYGARLTELREQLDLTWRRKAEALGQSYADEEAGKRFARLVEAGVAHSVLVLDDNGEALYPRLESETPSRDEANPRIEALRSRVREWALNPGDTETLQEIRTLLKESSALQIRDPHERLVVPDLQLLLLQQAGKALTEDQEGLRDDLATRLSAYNEPLMPSRQRCFLMAELQAFYPDLAFPTLEAERLAMNLLLEGRPEFTQAGLTATTLPGCWMLPSPDLSVIGLFDETRLQQEMQHRVDTTRALPGVTIRVIPPETAPVEQAFLCEPAGTFMPGWTLCLFLEGSDPLAMAADRKIDTYLWIGILTILMILILAIAMAGVLLRQMRLTRLKNDFVATVSHELKTPLSSMRVLVDTLLEGRSRDAGQTREYLQLIAHENERLSRLIENFLSFSRMERNKRAFEFSEVPPEEVVQTVRETVRERFETTGAELCVETASGLPPLTADRDALVTVLLNLLDNACKYSTPPLRVTLRTRKVQQGVAFEVEDNGIGLSRRDTRKIMDRFYQVDQSLARETGGCGLGLSIVQFIVQAHRGTIDVQSKPGQGSLFTITIPYTGEP